MAVVVVAPVLVAEYAGWVLLANSYGGRRMMSGGRPVGGTLHSLPGKEEVALPCCGQRFGEVELVALSSLSLRWCSTLSASISSSTSSGEEESKAVPAVHVTWRLPRSRLGRVGSIGGARVGAGTDANVTARRAVRAARRLSIVAISTAVSDSSTTAEAIAIIATAAAADEADRVDEGYHSNADQSRCLCTADGKVGSSSPQHRRTD